MGWTPPPVAGINAPEWKCHQPLESEGASTMEITTTGIDLAKNVPGARREPSRQGGAAQATSA